MPALQKKKMPARRSPDVVDDMQARAVTLTRPRSATTTCSRKKRKKNINESRWPDLPTEILGLFLSHLPRLCDYFRFGAVCKSWRSAQQQHKPKPQLPWLVMPDEEGSSARGFFSLSDDTVYHLSLPDLRGSRYCCGSYDDWLVVREEDGGNFLLNPFSRARIPLPQQTTIQSSQMRVRCRHNPPFICKAVLSCAPTSSCCLVAAITSSCDLEVCTPLGTTWATLDDRDNFREDSCKFKDIIFYKGQLYALNICEKLFTINVAGQRRIEATNCGIQRRRRHFHDSLRYFWTVHLVESGGKLLMVRRGIREYRRQWRTVKIQVFELEQNVPPRWTEVHSLGNHILFLGTDASCSVPAAGYDNSRGDCIYFMDSGGYPFLDCGVFFMGDKSISPFIPPGLHPSSSLPLWLPLSNVS